MAISSSISWWVARETLTSSPTPHRIRMGFSIRPMVRMGMKRAFSIHATTKSSRSRWLVVRHPSFTMASTTRTCTPFWHTVETPTWEVGIPFCSTCLSSHLMLYNSISFLGGSGPQVFPLPPGQGFPWAHSTRGKPRRGMMRRAVFSGKSLSQNEKIDGGCLFNFD